MKIGEVLEKIGDKGLTKDHLYYWEKIGLIKPKTIKKTKIERKEYSERELEKIILIWKYYKEGFPPKIAFEKALEGLHEAKQFKNEIFAEVLFCENETWNELMEKLKKLWGSDNIIRVLTSPLDKEIRETSIFKEMIRLLNSTEIKFSPDLLYELASRILSIIRNEQLILAGIVTTSPITSMIGSAVSVLGYTKYSMNLIPYVLIEEKKRKTKIVGGKPCSGCNVAIIIEKLISFREVLSTLTKVSVFNLKAPKIIGILDLLSKEDKDKINKEGYQIESIIKRENLIQYFSGSK